MRILIFSWRDIKHPQSGGAEILTLELAKRWSKNNHQVTIVSSNFPDAAFHEKLGQVEIYRPASFYSQSPRPYLNYIYQTAKFYRKNLAGKYDLALDQVHGLPFFTPFYVKEKVVLFPLEVAGRIWFDEIRFPYCLAGIFLERLYLILFKKRHFLTISPSTAHALNKRGVKNVQTITPGFSFHPQNKVPRKSPFPFLISLGRVTPMKRIEETLYAFRLLHKEFPVVKFLIIGRGKKEYLKKLKALCKDMAINDRVSFAGFVDEKEKRQFLSKAWALVSTSRLEGWGLNVIEAAACGTPTVAYNVAGLKDSIKDQITGLLCSKNNPQELGRNLRKILIDNRLRRQLSQNALTYSHQFSWNKTAMQGLKILEKILND